MKLYSEGIELDSNNHVRKEKAHPAASYTNDETPNESIDYHTHTLPDASSLATLVTLATLATIATLATLATPHPPHPSTHAQYLYGNRAAARQSIDDLDGALADALKAVEINPVWVKGYHRLATTYEGLGKVRESYHAYMQAESLDPTSVWVKEKLQAARSKSTARDAEMVVENEVEFKVRERWARGAGEREPGEREMGETERDRATERQREAEKQRQRDRGNSETTKEPDNTAERKTWVRTQQGERHGYIERGQRRHRQRDEQEAAL